MLLPNKWILLIQKWLKGYDTYLVTLWESENKIQCSGLLWPECITTNSYIGNLTLEATVLGGGACEEVFRSWMDSCHLERACINGLSVFCPSPHALLPSAMQVGPLQIPAHWSWNSQPPEFYGVIFCLLLIILSLVFCYSSTSGQRQGPIKEWDMVMHSILKDVTPMKGILIVKEEVEQPLCGLQLILQPSKRTWNVKKKKTNEKQLGNRFACQSNLIGW